MRPKRRKVGVVESDGRVRAVVVDDVAQEYRPQAAVLDFKQKGESCDD